MYSKFYTTEMVSQKKVIEKRFNHIVNDRKIKSYISFIGILLIFTIFSVSVFASGTAASTLGIHSNKDYTVFVYNGNQKINMTNNAIIEDGELYLPLREMLKFLGINEIEWDNGNIGIKLFMNDVYNRQTEEVGNYADTCSIAIGSQDFKLAPLYGPRNSYRAENEIIDKLRVPPIMKDGVTYVPSDFFSQMIYYGYFPNYGIILEQPTDPKAYYTEGEEVFIGTGKENDNYKPLDEYGNLRVVKRIVVDENGDAILVIPVKYQEREYIVNKMLSLAGCSYHGSQCYEFFNAGANHSQNAENVWIEDPDLLPFVIAEDGEVIAYVPFANQINGTKQINEGKLLHMIHV